MKVIKKIYLLFLNYNSYCFNEEFYRNNGCFLEAVHEDDWRYDALVELASYERKYPIRFRISKFLAGNKINKTLIVKK